MAKAVEVSVEIDEQGKLMVTINGTHGPECLNVLQFVDQVPGFTVVETGHTDAMKEKKVQHTGRQGVSR